VVPGLGAVHQRARWSGEHRVPIAAWPGRRGRPQAIVGALAGHVLGLFPLPRFLARVWFANDRADGDHWRGWIIAHGRGVSLRDLDLPIPLTRAMAHHFLASADHLEVPAALRQAEVLGLGGSAGLAAAVAATRVGDDLAHAVYWRRALTWLVRRQADLAAWQIGPIIDYLDAMRGWSPDTPPLGQRAAATVLREVERWHVLFGRTSTSARAWPRSRWQPLAHDEPHRDDERVCWRIDELTDPAALVAEGSAMRHCVASYAQRCQLGLTSIWSVRRRVERRDDLGRARPQLTIELDPRSAMIVQVRGFANRPPRGPGVTLLRRWASRERLAWAPGVLAAIGG
jgi:hypothetical protein